MISTMANSANSSSSNHENGVGGTSTNAFRISPSPLSSRPVSDPTITQLLHHAQTNEPLSINGDDEMVTHGAGQLGLNQRVSDELRSRPVLTTLTKRRSLLTTTTTTSTTTSSSNEGGSTMTEIAKTMLKSHLLYASAISDRLMPDQSNHNNNLKHRSPSLQNMSVSFQQSHMDYTCVTNTQYFHDDILDYPTLCGHIARPHLSSRKHPSQTRLATTGLNPDEPTTSDAKGKKPVTTGAPPSIEYFPDETVHKRGITNKPNRNDNHRPAGAPNPKPVIDIDNGDSDDGDNEQGHDGRIHSLPCQKHGPYTCSKCMKVLPTSQHFAAHAAADHYKYETKEQRRKRQIAKVRRRALKLQQVKDGLTCVPIFYEWEDAGGAVLAGNSSAENSANGGGDGGGEMKEQSASEVRSNDFVVPPGFEGAGIKREGGFSSA